MRLITDEPEEEKKAAFNFRTRLIKITAIVIAFATSFFFFIKILFF